MSIDQLEIPRTSYVGDPSVQIDSDETPLCIPDLGLPQAAPVTSGLCSSMPLMFNPEIIDSGLSYEELGVFLWIARQQQMHKPVTVRSVADWISDQHRHETGETINQTGLVWQLIRRLQATYLVCAEPKQAKRLEELVQFEDQWAERAAQKSPPAPRLERHAARSAPDPVNHQPNEDGQWSGAWPMTHQTSYPPKGQNVVYVLRAASGLVIYVGSTNHFYARMKAHFSSGKRWAEWVAHPCESREEAYEVESEFLQEFMPHLNVAGPRSSENHQ